MLGRRQPETNDAALDLIARLADVVEELARERGAHEVTIARLGNIRQDARRLLAKGRG